jgi:sterol desaturase/sphingolipid hydroxylase (fatty acid hydroxylase superfamily)
VAPGTILPVCPGQEDPQEGLPGRPDLLVLHSHDYRRLYVRRNASHRNRDHRCFGWRHHGRQSGNRPPPHLITADRALQYLTALVAADFLGYWAHRLFHSGKLWDFHAVHHASEELDWLSSVRLHPVNQAFGQILIVAPLALLGFNLQILSATAGLLTFWAIFVHSNVRWTFGPLRHFIATPAFHRWHHTRQAEGLDKNFGGLFLFWDRLFGTLYLPEGRQAQQFGLFGEQVPDSFFRQLLWPFTKGRSA